MDGEIVDALLALLDQRVAINLPSEILSDAIDLLQRLIDRHRANRNRAVADDPFTRVVNVAPGRKVHDIVGAPAGRPDHFLDLFLDRRGHSGIADISIDLDQEVAANDLRLQFRVVDVGGNDGAAAGNLIADKFRGDEFRDLRPEALTLLNLRLGVFDRFLATKILALGDVDHFLGDDPGLGIFKLRQRASTCAAQRLVLDRKLAGEIFSRRPAIIFRLHIAALVHLDMAALQHPIGAVAGKPLFDINRHARV